jgi:DNA-binding CsgD family transcriptional regulator
MRQVTETSQNNVALVLFLVVAILVGADLVADAGSGAGVIHIGTEGLATLVALTGAVWFGRRILADRAESATWRAQAEELLAGVGNTIENQFAAWELSPAEAEVGLLLLKGLSFKEVAQVRGTSERTAREQARAIYRKAGIAGRAELSAWFIEDLLPPSA